MRWVNLNRFCTCFFFPGIKLFFPLALSEQLIGLCICSFHLCSRCVLASSTSVKVRRGTKHKRERQTWKKGSLISRSPTKNGRSDTGQTERGSVHFERLIKRFWPPLQKKKKKKEKKERKTEARNSARVTLRVRTAQGKSPCTSLTVSEVISWNPYITVRAPCWGPLCSVMWNDCRLESELWAVRASFA